MPIYLHAFLPIYLSTYMPSYLSIYLHTTCVPSYLPTHYPHTHIHILYQFLLRHEATVVAPVRANLTAIRAALTRKV